MWKAPRCSRRPQRPTPARCPPHQARAHLDLICTLPPLGIRAAGWKRLPPRYTIFAACFALLALSLPVAGPEPLASAPRYLMVILPIIVIAALWGAHPRVDRLVMAVAPALLAVSVALFVSHYWVA